MLTYGFLVLMVQLFDASEQPFVLLLKVLDFLLQFRLSIARRPDESIVPFVELGADTEIRHHRDRVVVDGGVPLEFLIEVRFFLLVGCALLLVLGFQSFQRVSD